MFRYNANGEFNVPYGGISYNRKDFKKKIDYIESEELITKLASTKLKRPKVKIFSNKQINQFLFFNKLMLSPIPYIII